MAKRALLVGINQYDHTDDLSCCVADATEMARVLERHDDYELNFECILLTTDKQRVTLNVLRQYIEKLLEDLPGGDVLFYFSGHGMTSESDGYLTTQDTSDSQAGFNMTELLDAANQAGVGSATIILDCCHAGAIGHKGKSTEVSIGEGVTIISSSSADQLSEESFEHSVFTELVLAALQGGAADIRGHVSAASIYAYSEQALGAWNQRPLYRSNARELNPVRICDPKVSARLLAQLTVLFNYPEMKFKMGPEYEHSSGHAEAEKVETFNLFKTYRDAGLLRGEGGVDLYYAAIDKKCVELTPLGRFYWRLVADKLV